MIYGDNDLQTDNNVVALTKDMKQNMDKKGLIGRYLSVDDPVSLAWSI